ncbi:MAG: class I SAM-dependent methyltransferase [Pseudomonadota bacterium]
MADHQVDFGASTVSATEKTRLVRGVFSSVARRYDVMNDLMSLGLHRVWKQVLLDLIRPNKDQILLDVAGGTGDIAQRFISHGGGKAVICDLTEAMLVEGQNRLINRGSGRMLQSLHYTVGNGEALPFADRQFDVVTIAFGLRNIAHRDLALCEMQRVCKLGGRFFCLEFAEMTIPALQSLYEQYNQRWLPVLGQLIAGDRSSYRYLAESIRRFPSRHEVRMMMEQAGFERICWTDLSGGIVALHTGTPKAVR